MFFCNKTIEIFYIYSRVEIKNYYSNPKNNYHNFYAFMKQIFLTLNLLEQMLFLDMKFCQAQHSILFGQTIEPITKTKGN